MKAPEHLKKFAWYLPHQAWLAKHDQIHHDPEGEKPKRANLSEANLYEADLRGANLRGASLSEADLRGAILTEANLSEADLAGALFSQFKYTSFESAVEAVKAWLQEGRWIQDKWIETPDGAYSGTCKACLHGAAIYIGGNFGVEISRRLNKKQYSISWNDNTDRTFDDVLSALEDIKEESQ